MQEEHGKRFHRLERSYGKVARLFAGREDAADDKIKAEFKEGMLFVHLPKSEKVRPRAIEAKVE